MKKPDSNMITEMFLIVYSGRFRCFESGKGKRGKRSGVTFMIIKAQPKGKIGLSHILCATDTAAEQVNDVRSVTVIAAFYVNRKVGVCAFGVRRF